MTQHKVLKPFWLKGHGDLKKGATTPPLDSDTRDHLISLKNIDESPVKTAVKAPQNAS